MGREAQALLNMRKYYSTKFQDLVGRRFERLLVISRSLVRRHSSIFWDCKCDCGNTHIASGRHLKGGKIRSCGCLHKEILQAQRGEKNRGWKGGKWKKYGLSPVDYQHRLEEQMGVCKICKNACDCKASLSIDHDHKTGRVRGLLCFRCNVALGSFRDSVEVLKSAISYLEEGEE